MKNLKEYLNEGLLSRKISTKTPIRYIPKDTGELVAIIVDLLKNGQTNLNCIDTSNITNMCVLFQLVSCKVNFGEIDISEWDVSNVTDMGAMFEHCEDFICDLSNWNVSNVEDMGYMFYGCKKFNSDLSNWNVKNVTDMRDMFVGCSTLRKYKLIPKWYK